MTAEQAERSIRAISSPAGVGCGAGSTTAGGKGHNAVDTPVGLEHRSRMPSLQYRLVYFNQDMAHGFFHCKNVPLFPGGQSRGSLG